MDITISFIIHSAPCTDKPTLFPAECCKKRLNECSFVLLFCVVSSRYVLSFCAVCVFKLSSLLICISSVTQCEMTLYSLIVLMCC